MPVITVGYGTPAAVNLGSGGGTVTNYGPATVLYSDSQDLPPAEGTLTAGQSAFLSGTQFLYAPSRADVDVPAAAAGDAAGIPASTIDAKGDLLVGTADNTVARKAVGADGLSLVADSSKADGLDWVDRAPSRSLPPGWFIGPRVSARSTQSLSGIARMGVWIPVDAEAQPVDLLRWEVTTIGDASSVLTVGLYRMRSPASLTVDRVAVTGAISATSTGVKDASITSVTLPRGLYLAVMEPTGHSATPPTIRSSAAATSGSGVYSADTSEVSDPRGGVQVAALTNAAGLPSSFALVAQTVRSVGPMIYARTA